MGISSARGGTRRPDASRRLREVVSRMSAHRMTDAALGGSRAASSAPLGLAFRFLARLGLFQAFIDRQRLVNTFVTNIKGPPQPVTVAGHQVTSIVPVAIRTPSLVHAIGSSSSGT